MRMRVACLVLLLSAGFITLTMTRAQDRTVAAPQTPTATAPAPVESPAPRPAVPVSSAPRPAPAALDPNKLEGLQRQIYLSAYRGTDWLWRMNLDKGRFLDGWVPALNAPLEGEDFLRQAGSAYVLARAARLTGEERYAARATQAILSLLDSTEVDPNAPTIRYTPMPSIVLNRLGAAAWLVLAIGESPVPSAELLDRSEQLCNFVRPGTEHAPPPGAVEA
jgi:hypothetical protein